MATWREKSWYRKCLSMHVLVEFEDCYLTKYTCPASYYIISSLEARNIMWYVQCHAVSSNQGVGRKFIVGRPYRGVEVHVYPIVAKFAEIF